MSYLTMTIPVTIRLRKQTGLVGGYRDFVFLATFMLALVVLLLPAQASATFLGTDTQKVRDNPFHIEGFGSEHSQRETKQKKGGGYWQGYQKKHIHPGKRPKDTSARSRHQNKKSKGNGAFFSEAGQKKRLGNRRRFRQTRQDVASPKIQMVDQ